MSSSSALILLLNLVLIGAALIDCLAKDRRDVRGLPMGGWILVIVLLAPLGGLVWLVAGRPRKRKRQVDPPAKTPPVGWEPAIGGEPPVGAPDGQGLPAAYEPPPGPDPLPRRPHEPR